MSARLDNDELRARLAQLDEATRELLRAADWQRLDHKGRELWIDPNTTFRWRLPLALAMLRKDLGA